MKKSVKPTTKKYAKVKRMPKANARMKRHFDDGGDVDVGDITAPTLGSTNYDDLSFNKAFALARQMGDKNFQWRGGTYGTQLAKPSQATPEVVTTARRFPQASTSDRDASGKYLDPEMQAYAASRPTFAQALKQSRAQNEGDLAKFLGGTAATGAGLGVLGGTVLAPDALEAIGFGSAAPEEGATARFLNSPMAKATLRRAADQARRNALKMKNYLADPNTPMGDIVRMAQKSGLGYKKGGKIEKVAKYAKGGHIGSKRGDGLAKKGKTKGRVR